MANKKTTSLLVSCLPYISNHGFTKHALTASQSTLSPYTISALFPGPDTSATSLPRRLFQTWDQVCNLEIQHGITHQQAIEEILNPTITNPLPKIVDSHNDQNQAFITIANQLEQRLRQSWKARLWLMDAFSLQVSQPLVQHRIIPLPPSLKGLDVRIPNPAPLFHRSFQLTDDLLVHSPNWIDPDTSDWYMARMRLTVAYLFAELHMASGRFQHVDQSLAFFTNMVEARQTGLFSTASQLAQDASLWASWGSRGWLGTLRSLGL